MARRAQANNKSATGLLGVSRSGAEARRADVHVATLRLHGQLRTRHTGVHGRLRRAEVPLATRATPKHKSHNAVSCHEAMSFIAPDSHLSRRIRRQRGRDHETLSAKGRGR